MALDPEKSSEFLERMDKVIEWIPLQDKDSKRLVEKFLGEGIDELQYILESRPPRLYVFGRTGAGKSSMINALANKPVATVGDIAPTTAESKMHHIQFPKRSASWEVIDSRGLFESISPDGGIPKDTVSLMKQDLKNLRPDVLLHVMSPDQVRAGKIDFEIVEEFRKELGVQFPPIAYCLNKVDTHLTPNDDWPPEDNPPLARDIKKNIDFVQEVLHEETKTTISENQPLYGYKFDSDKHIGVVPVYSKEKPYWNIETLSTLIGEDLPADARFQFYQAQRREGLMRNVSRDVTRRFAAISSSIGGTPMPVADVFLLMPLQLMLVGTIGAFSCRELEWATVGDYLSAVGGTTVSGMVAREIARSLTQVIPAVGMTISAAVAYGTTWAIGRSAEEYFFNDKVVKPSKLVKKGKKTFKRDTKRTTTSSNNIWRYVRRPTNFRNKG